MPAPLAMSLFTGKHSAFETFFLLAVDYFRLCLPLVSDRKAIIVLLKLQNATNVVDKVKSTRVTLHPVLN